MRFIHTSDWQIGEVFRQVDDGTMAVLQTERLEAIGRLGRLAREQRAPLVLVAGDVYDSDKPSDRTLEQPIERMRAFPEVRWHLLPGNHDSHQPNGLWDRLRKKGLPDNIVLHLEPGPKAIEGVPAVLLPAPLTRRPARPTMGSRRWPERRRATGVRPEGCAARPRGPIPACADGG
jgi:DNA repair exonuclease SbcCD nuclease subunit